MLRSIGMLLSREARGWECGIIQVGTVKIKGAANAVTQIVIRSDTTLIFQSRCAAGGRHRAAGVQDWTPPKSEKATVLGTDFGIDQAVCYLLWLSCGQLQMHAERLSGCLLALCPNPYSLANYFSILTDSEEQPPEETSWRSSWNGCYRRKKDSRRRMGFS